MFLGEFLLLSRFSGLPTSELALHNRSSLLLRNFLFFSFFTPLPASEPTLNNCGSLLLGIFLLLCFMTSFPATESALKFDGSCLNLSFDILVFINLLSEVFLLNSLSFSFKFFWQFTSLWLFNLLAICVPISVRQLSGIPIVVNILGFVVAVITDISGKGRLVEDGR